MKRLLIGLTAPVLAVSLLAGCGSDDTSAEATQETASPSDAESPSGQPSEDAAGDAEGADTEYCKLLSTDFATLFANMQGPEDVNEAVGIMKQIADEAPADVEDDWAVMEGALGQMKGALLRAAELQKKAENGEISKTELQKQTATLMKDMQALDTPRNNKAGDAVSQHATKYCGISLG